MEILIDNRQNFLTIKSQPIEELSVLVLKKEKSDELAEVSVSLVTEEEIAGLNRRYRNLDAVTDVLSFSFNQEPPISHLLGDVVICPAEAARKANELSVDFNEYFGLLIVHSILHLLGYGHKQDMDAKVMLEKEKKILKEFAITGKSFT